MKLLDNLRVFKLVNDVWSDICHHLSIKKPNEKMGAKCCVKPYCRAPKTRRPYRTSRMLRTVFGSPFILFVSSAKQNIQCTYLFVLKVHNWWCPSNVIKPPNDDPPRPHTPPIFPKKQWTLRRSSTRFHCWTNNDHKT